MGENIPYSDMRQNYDKGELRDLDIRPLPADQFQKWMEEAVHNPGIIEPNIMSLATVSSGGQPSIRQVLLKGMNEDRPIWYTNYNSRKGKDLAQNPRAALLFFWESLERQVRIEGVVQKISPEQSDSYFNSRPRGSRIGAAISPQSEIVDKAELERLFAKAENEYSNTEIPRPAYWGGYEMIPESWEFWQGRPNRLHDRFLYVKSGEEWLVRRLAP